MKIKYMLLALVPLCMASCSEEENVVSGEVKQKVRVVASADAQSRVVLSDIGNRVSTLWQDGDRISLFTSTQSNLVYSTSLNEEATTAIFTSVDEALESVEGDTVYACRPDVTLASEEGVVVSLPATAELDYDNCVSRSFGYAVDTISNGSVRLKFKHISAFLGMMITPDMLSDATKGISTITVSTSSNAPLSVGEGDTFDFATRTASITNGTNTVKVNVDNQIVDTGSWTFYVPILPQPAGANITVTLADSEGQTLYTITKPAPEGGFVAGYAYLQSATFEVAYLMDGSTFRERVNRFLNNEGYDSYQMEQIKFETEVRTFPDKFVEVSTADSPTPVYATFTSEDALLTVFTLAKNIEIEDASYMFADFTSLRTIDFGNFKISEKTTNMAEMFRYCYNLESLDVSGWNTENVTDMYAMFYDCYALATLDVSNWNVGKVENMDVMFSYCESLTSLDASGWNTENVSDMNRMFNGCYTLTTLNLRNWNTARVESMWGMFNGCTALTALDLANWDVSNVYDMYDMFAGCQNLAKLNISNWSFNDDSSMYYMFSDCASVSQACRVFYTMGTKEFLLERTGTTYMNPDWFIWEENGSSHEDMPEVEW